MNINFLRCTHLCISRKNVLFKLLLLGVLSILFGFFILLTRISANHLNGHRRISEVDLRSTDFVNDTVATAMFDEVRILCWIMTNSENYIKRAIHIKKTWGKRCNKLLFMGSRNHEDWNSIELAVGEGRNQLWNKTKAAFTYIYKYHLSEADWFLKTDDDTYIIMENLRYLLYPYRPETPIYFGCEFRMRRKISREIAMFMSGGAGYVLSKEALRRFIKEAIPVSDSQAFNEDVEMGVSLKKANVVDGCSLDNQGQSRFFPMPPRFHLKAVPRNDWFWHYMLYKNEKDCCSEYTIAFHYIGPNSMYIMDFLLYNVQPYGIVSTPLKLPKKLELNTSAKPCAATTNIKWQIANDGDIRPFIRFIADCTEKTLNIYLWAKSDLPQQIPMLAQTERANIDNLVTTTITSSSSSYSSTRTVQSNDGDFFESGSGEIS